MTPTALARFSLRILSAAIFFLYMPPRIEYFVFAAVSSPLQIFDPSTDYFSQLVQVVGLIGFCAAAWFNRRFSATLLPNTVRDQPVHGDEPWQTLCLSAIGGILIISTSWDLIGSATGPQSYHFVTTILSLLSGLFLLIGWPVWRRALRTNWWKAFVAYRRSLADRP